MTLLKSILFENGSLTDATDGFDSTLGSPTLDTTSKIKGANSMRTQAVGDFGREDVTASDSLYVSFYVNFATLPASGTTRFAFIRSGATALGSIRVLSSGVVRLLNAANGTIGDSSPIITTSAVYRIGLRYTKGTGANAILEGLVAANDDAFGAAFASTSTDTGTAQADRVEVGQTASGTLCDVYADDIKIDNATMPGPSVAGGGMLFAHRGMTGGMGNLSGGMRG